MLAQDGNCHRNAFARNTGFSRHTRKVCDKLDIAKVSLLIVRTCVSIGGIHLQGSSANQSAQNDYLLMTLEYSTSLESALADIFICVRNAGYATADIFDTLVNVRHYLMDGKKVM